MTVKVFKSIKDYLEITWGVDSYDFDLMILKNHDNQFKLLQYTYSKEKGLTGSRFYTYEEILKIAFGELKEKNRPISEAFSTFIDIKCL